MADNQKSTPSGQVRLVMWTTPRSVSTAFSKCISFVEDSLIFFEPYFVAHRFGPDRLKDAPHQAKFKTFMEGCIGHGGPTVTSGFQASDCTYKWVKEQLEEPHIGKRLVFNKDMAFGVIGKLEFLPKGYRHMFLVRHPLKVFSSWKKTCDRVVPEFFDGAFDFSEMSKLLDHVKMTQDQDPIIIDADDLLNDPRGILSALFKEIGLPFEERILQWEADDAITQQWVYCNEVRQGNQLWEYYKKAFDSTCFTKPSALPDRSSLPDDVLRCVNVSMPYYEKMYAQRLIPLK